VLLLVENEKRVKKKNRESSELNSLKKGYWVLILWLRLKSKSKRIILYSVYIRELDGAPVTEYLPYIHLTNSLCYTKPILYAINMWYNIIIPESSIFFCDIWLCDYDMWYCDMTCDILWQSYVMSC